MRLGVHTGLVVVDDVGVGPRGEPLALGETLNIAARLQHVAASNTLVISAATHQLVTGYVQCQALEAHTLPGLAQPLAVYHVLGTSGVQSRLAVAALHGLTPLVGRAQDVALLTERWTRVTDGLGQVVLLMGEAGIGKSRLAQALIAHVAATGHGWLEGQGSPYYQQTAFYPLIELLERAVLRWDRDEAPPQKLHKLEVCVQHYGLPRAEVVPLLAALLALPLPADYAPLTLAPEQQKQQTLQALLRLLLGMAAQQPLLLVLEDLHWVDPSTLEWLSLLVDQGPTTRLLAVCTYRPDFRPPWTGRAHLTQMTVARLPQAETATLTQQVAHGKALPPEVVAQIVAKTDGVPLFVEELTKMVLESGLLRQREERYDLTGPLPPLAIPATLHDSLLARLDRLGAVKGLAQLGATLGRAFAYTLLHAVSPWDEGTLQRGLQQLVEAEFLYRQGLPPQATYVFKHALIQDAAYQSLLKRTRQQYHQRIAQVLVAQFPATAETQPELVAQHYTAAGLPEQATGYWQRASQRALARSAYAEAIHHMTTGIALLTTLPETPDRLRQELDLQIALGTALMATRGLGAPEAKHAYDRARLLCQQLDETPKLFAVLSGLARWYLNQTAFSTAQEYGEHLLTLAQRLHDPARVVEANRMLGNIVFWRGEVVRARAHLEAGLALYHAYQSGVQAMLSVRDPGVEMQGFMALTLWFLGYPDQAFTSCQKALHLAQAVAHPYSLAVALNMTAWFHQCRRERLLTHECAEAVLALAAEHGFAQRQAASSILRGWALAAQERVAEGIAAIRQGLAAWHATGTAIWQPYFLALLAEACAHGGHVEEGLTVLTEALAVVDRTGEGLYEAEVYRLRGALLLRQDPPDALLAEACFQQALEVARRQQAKSLELRAAMSLSRLWQQQGRRADAYDLLAPLYGWFTEGLDTADLQEAKALLEALGG